MGDYVEKLRRYIAGIELRDGTTYAPPTPSLPGFDPAAQPFDAARSEASSLEAVIRMARPVLDVISDLAIGIPEIVPLHPEAREMADRVATKAAALAPVMRSVGRIELAGNDDYAWVGTGWLIASEMGDDIIVTNAHVALIFSEAAGKSFVFRETTDGRMGQQTAHIDFREEVRPTTPREFPVKDIVYVSQTRGMDVAFLRVSRTSGADRLTAPIVLAPAIPSPTALLAAIGYPGYSSTDHDSETLQRIFGNVHERKRISPGRLMGLEPRGLAHDCSTLPGSSGSLLVDLETGTAVGLHYRGRALEANHAVPAADILRLIRERPWQGTGLADGSPVKTDPPIVGSAKEDAAQGDTMATKATVTTVSATRADGSITLTIPLEITVRLGSMPRGADAAPAVERTLPPTRRNAERAAEAAKERMTGHAQVLSVAAGLMFKEGLISEDYGVIVKVRPEAPKSAAAYGLPDAIEGIPIVVETASVERLLAADFGIAAEEAALPARFGYERDITAPEFSLAPVTEEMTITLHVSPEAGWSQLSSFLGRTDFNRMTVGMYHMSAPHVLEAILKAMQPAGRELKLTIDRKKGDDIGEGTKKNDKPESETLAAWGEALGARFEFTPAAISGRNKLFHSAYHIKVAVISEETGASPGDKAFWLSSGNWQSSNQAPLKKAVSELTFGDVRDYNREWHAIVESPTLAGVFRRHLEQDFLDNKAAGGEEAAALELPLVLVPEALFDADVEAPRAFRAFEPLRLDRRRVTVTPVLTPDNYADVVIPLIESARTSVLFENQSFGLSEDEDNMPDHFLDLAKALRQQQRRGRDVRIIFRSGFGKERDTVRKLVEFGFKAGSIRFFDKVHTKGIVVDAAKVLLGSQNWTGAGTGPNRDASLLIETEEAGAYFQQIFEYDWREMARSRVRDDLEALPPIRVLRGGNEAGIPNGYRVVRWADAMDF
ncbi:phospholipase D-like domain-containing protein [Xanthobacter sp. KR7-225]|uniref:phospholipase D-like domain-containing protein n=1 Tax=Xanthobacter sp. KR7-225 TaxID=3156613 RepID=UPI0032B62A24